MMMDGLWRRMKQIQLWTLQDDLEVPPIVDNSEGDGINENEDHVEEDDSPAFYYE